MQMPMPMPMLLVTTTILNAILNTILNKNIFDHFEMENINYLQQFANNCLNLRGGCASKV